jgi:uncharacterized protein YbjT (DUF2867 family)
MILVTGATVEIGRRVVRLLRQQQKSVRSFVRLTSHYSELEHRNSDIFIGDLPREQDIQKACQGAKYIISAHGSGNLVICHENRIFRKLVRVQNISLAPTVQVMMFYL